MKAIVHQHPEWEIVERWFATRAAGNWNHAETITFESCFDPEMVALATDLSRRLGESIARLVKDAA